MASDRQIYQVEELAESSTIQATYQTKATLTFTPDANSTYLIISSAIVMNDDASSAVKFRLYDNTGSNVLSEQIYRPKDITDYISAGAAATQSFGASPSSQTYYAQYCTTGLAGPVAYIAQARTIAIKLTSNDKYNSSTGRTTYNTNTTYQTKVATTFTPSTTGDYLIIASAVLDGSSSTYDSRVRIDVDGSTQYGTMNIEAINSANRVGYIYFQLKNLSNASHTINLQYGTENTSNTVGISYAWITVLRLDEFFYTFSNEDNTERSWASTTPTSTATLDSSTATATTHIFLGSGLCTSKGTSTSVYAIHTYDWSNTDIATATLEMKDTTNYHAFFSVRYDTSPSTIYNTRVGGSSTGYVDDTRMYLLQAKQGVSTSYATITQNIQYKVGKSYSLSENSTYCVPSIKSTYQNASYTVGKSYSQSQNINYNVSKTHEQTQNVVYKVQKTNSTSQTTSYCVAKTYSTTLDAAYDVLVATEHTLTQDAGYKVQSTGSKSQTISYKVLSLHSIPLPCSYSVAKSTTKSQTIVYKVSKSYSTSLTGSYKVSKSYSQSLTSSYSVSKVYSQTRDIIYRVARTYSKTLDSEYDVLSSTTQTISHDVRYIVQATQTKSLTASYFIFGEGEPHTISETIQYIISATHSITKNIQYLVSKVKSTSQTIQYNIGVLKSKTQTIQYKVGSGQSKTLTDRYTVLATKSTDKQIQYKVSASHTTTLTAAYTISRTITIDCSYSVAAYSTVYKSIQYCVPSTSTLQLSSEYSTGTRTEETIQMSCSYSVPHVEIISKIIETRVKSFGVAHKFQSRVILRS